MSGVGQFIRKRRAKRAAFMADPAIIKLRVRAVVRFGVETAVLCPVLGQAMWRMER